MCALTKISGQDGEVYKKKKVKSPQCTVHCVDGPRAGYKPHHFNARQPAYSSVSILGMVRLGLLYFHIHLILKRKKGRMDTRKLLSTPKYVHTYYE